MNEELLKYFTLTKENSLILKELNKNMKAEIRIPDENFNINMATISGDNVIVFGFLDIFVWESYDENISKDSDAIKILLRLPNIITTAPTRILHDSKNEEYVLEYQEGDKIIVSTKVPKSTSVVMNFFELITKGKIPDDISYQNISKYFEECTKINSFNGKVNSLFIDLIIAVVCRDPNNVSRQFREAIKENPKISMYSRKLVNMEMIPAITTQFGAISSGSPKYGITSSIGAVRSGDMNPEEDNISSYFE